MICLGDAVVDEARGDLGSHSDYGIPGVFCSIAVKTWMDHAAAKLGVPAPIKGSPAAKSTMAQFQARGEWFPADVLRATPGIVKPGMIAVWHRGDPGACTGHIGVVETEATADGVFGTIEANAAPIVSRFQRRLDGESFIGMGYFTCAMGTGVLATLTATPGRTLATGAAVVGAATLLAVLLRRRRVQTHAQRTHA